MTDRELLELAAKAAGLKNFVYERAVAGNWNIYHGDAGDPRDCWNPLEDDGDALRLADRLSISIHQNIWEIGVSTIALTLAGVFIKESTIRELDSLAATRRAIVRAAAAIGKAMP